jgi:hypothetical protein
MANVEDLPINTPVMVTVADVMHKGVIAEPRVDCPLSEGTICVELTPPVKTMKPFDSIDFVTCPASSVVLGWWPFDD